MEARVLYLDLRPDEISLRLRGALTAPECGTRIEYFSSDRSLLERLFGAPDDITLVIIRVRDFEHLVQLSAHSMLLRESRVVVLLPEMGHEAITLAHVIHPSLVLGVDDDFGGIAAMIEKLARWEEELGQRRKVQTRRSAGSVAKRTRKLANRPRS